MKSSFLLICALHPFFTSTPSSSITKTKQKVLHPTPRRGVVVTVLEETPWCFLGPEGAGGLGWFGCNCVLTGQLVDHTEVVVDRVALLQPLACWYTTVSFSFCSPHRFHENWELWVQLIPKWFWEAGKIDSTITSPISLKARLKKHIPCYQKKWPSYNEILKHVWFYAFYENIETGFWRGRVESFYWSLFCCDL